MDDSPDDYCAIPLDEISTEEDLRCDFFIRIGTEKFLKMANKGDRLNSEQLENLRTKNVSGLFVRAADFGAHLGVTRSIQPSSDNAEAMSVLRADSEAAVSLLYANDFNEILFETAKTTIDNLMHVVGSNDGLLKLLAQLRMSQGGDVVFAHSVAVSAVAVMLARAMDIKSTSLIYKLGLAGLLHDVGTRDMPPGLNKSSGAYQEHPRRSAEILAMVPDVPGDVITMVLMHHENCLGTGYPAGLKKARVHPMARVLAVADKFCEIVLESTAIQAAQTDHHVVTNSVNALMKSKELDPRVLQALAHILGPASAPIS